MSGLKLYTSNRVEELSACLAELMRDDPLRDPLQAEIIIVQSRGMERWLSLELARHLGICAHIRFPFPIHFVYDVFRHTLGNIPETSPYDPAVLTWKIMHLLPRSLDGEAFQSLRYYLGNGGMDLRCYQLSARIAGVFNQYLLFRPEMIRKWERGDENHWQAVLWRNLAQGIESSLHLAALQEAFFQGLREQAPAWPDMPRRVSVFGVSALPPFHLKILATIANFMEVNLFLMNPSREYWHDIVSDREMTRIAERTKSFGFSEGEDLHLEHGHGLLASLGTLGRDFFQLLNDYPLTENTLFEEPGEENLLRTIQSDILNLRERGREGKKLLPETDNSLRIHSCHTPMREIEILQDRLLSFFADDPGLKPGDILVMTPDIGLYAPFIQAVFSLPSDDSRWLPFSIADRSIPQESPLIETFFRLLALNGSRFPASEVFDILATPAVRERFSLSETDLQEIHHWLQDTGIRWGTDAESRGGMGLPSLPWNTWRAGLERLLLGYALTAPPEGRLFQGILPYNQIEGSVTDILGRFLNFTDTLFRSVSALSEQRTLQGWAECLLDFSDNFFAATEERLRDLQALRRTLHKLAELQELSGFPERIPLDTVRAWLKENIAGQTFGTGFLTGGVTFCAMLPMRSIPFRIICLLGMGDDSYPRRSFTPGFDLMTKQPRPGDRSLRNDDRYLFLEAILSARDKLHISFVGQDIRDNSSRPPSVLVSELIDSIEEGFEFSQGEIRAGLVLKHPLQAFSPAYFGDNRQLFSYSPENAAAARRAVGKREGPRALISADLPGAGEEWQTVNLSALCRFFANPVRYLLQERLGIRLEDDQAILEDKEHFTLDNLEKYQLRRELIDQGLSGLDITSRQETLLAAGRLPHGNPGICSYEDQHHSATAFLARLAPLSSGRRLADLIVDSTIGPYHLTGRIEHRYEQGVIHFRPAKVRANDRLQIWITHLFLHLTPDFEGLRQSTYVGEDMTCRYPSLTDPGEHLAKLLAIYWEGLHHPLHFFPRTSAAYAEAIFKGKEEDAAMNAALSQWRGYKGKGNNQQPGEREEPYVQLCFTDTDHLDDAFQELSLSIFVPILALEERT
ncbi:MAG: exodeoxyribonuclease V subunit gamma [Syntrophus sp. (in: bacteria)]